MPPQPCWMLVDCLNDMQHCVRTQLGQSDAEYASSLGEYLFGTGQGNGGSPAFWLSTLETILNTMEKLTTGYIVRNPTGTTTSSRLEDMYVDDASIITNSSQRGETTELLAANAQIHEQLLFSTGGRLALHKCFWTTLRFHWAGGKALIEHYDKTEHSSEPRMPSSA